tara:strand:+ start:1526 stop:2143 length:618 start_codon:yes stop_codon:yes gene_type:complete
MRLNNNFWWFSKALSEDFCSKVIEKGFEKKPSLATIGEYEGKKLNPKTKKDLKKKRDSSITFLEEDFIYKEIDQIINVANFNAGWNFKLDHYQPAQFTVYGKGQHYNWHVDSSSNPYSQEHHKNFRGKIRKLSMSISLNDSKEYKGGELLIDLSSPMKKEIFKIDKLKEKGTAVVFPSHLWHRVTPVTKGVRYSLVVWALGTPWQ